MRRAVEIFQKLIFVCEHPYKNRDVRSDPGPGPICFAIHPSRMAQETSANPIGESDVKQTFLIPKTS